MSVAALVFDFGGVISKTMFETHALTEKELGLAANSLQWRGPFDPQIDDVWRSMQLDEISERDYWLHRARETGDLLGERWDSMNAFVQKARGSNPMEIIRPEFFECIEQAKNKGLRLAILSNELDLFYGADFREKLPFLHDFELVIDATYTQILKPDSRAYNLAISGLKLAPAQCLFIDDQQRNIDGAIGVGMQTQWFDVLNPADSYASILKKI